MENFFRLAFIKEEVSEMERFDLSQQKNDKGKERKKQKEEMEEKQ